MSKLLSIFFLVTLCLFELNAQTFPYLNASTGNEGQYIVDADTNIFMYHDNQLEKYDKNFNPIWVKTYSGLNFYSLLLSKTGSIYFISKNATTSNYTNIIGKLDSNGNVNWCKQFQTSNSLNSEYFCQMLLDKNNHLAISGSDNVMTGSTSKKAWFLKLDTLGTIISSKLFDTPGITFEKFVITEDSLNTYRFIADFWAFESGGIMVFKFNNILDSIINIGIPATIGQQASIVFSKFYKSKYDSSVYFSFHRVANFNGLPYGNIIKYRNDSIIWNLNFNIPNSYTMDSFDEDEFGNIFYTVSCGYCSSYAFTNSSTKINSNCTIAQSTQYFFSYIFSPTINTSDIKGKIHSLYGNKYFYDLSGSVFSTNPQYVTPLDSNLNSNCTTSNSYTISSIASGNFMNPNYHLDFQVINDASTFNNLYPTVTTISSFSCNTNYCLLTANKERKKETENFSINPNPANNSINILSSNNIEEVSVFDVNGKKIVFDKNTITIDVSILLKGMYFLKIKTDQGEFSRKFIKE